MSALPAALLIAALTVAAPEAVEPAPRSLEAQPAPAPTTGFEAAKLKEILDRPEFAGARGREEGAVALLLRRLNDWLSELFETREALDFAQGTRLGVLVLTIALTLAAVLRFGRRRVSGEVGPVVGEEGHRLPLEAPSAHFARAQEALDLDPRRAIREALLALLSALEQQRLARPDRVRTNRELAAELPSRGASAPISRSVSEVVGWYDRAFYSLAPVEVPEARAFLDTVARLRAQLEHVGAA